MFALLLQQVAETPQLYKDFPLLAFWKPISFLLAAVLLFIAWIINNITNRGTLKNDIVDLASRIRESTQEIEQFVKVLVTNVEIKLSEQSVRIAQLETIDKRWESGHLVDKQMEQIRVRVTALEVANATMTKNMDALRETVQQVSVDNAKNLAEVQQTIAVLAEKFDAWGKRFNGE